MDPNIIVMALMDTQYLKLIVCFANRADPDVIAEQLDTIRTIQLILGYVYVGGDIQYDTQIDSPGIWFDAAELLSQIVITAPAAGKLGVAPGAGGTMLFSKDWEVGKIGISSAPCQNTRNSCHFVRFA